MKEALTSLLDTAVNDLIAKGQVPEVPDLAGEKSTHGTSRSCGSNYRRTA